MPINNREVKIVKVPLQKSDRMPNYPQNFPMMPRLYLELLENKAKIKQNLINKEYVPRDRGTTQNIDEKEKSENKRTEANFSRTKGKDVSRKFDDDFSDVRDPKNMGDEQRESEQRERGRHEHEHRERGRHEHREHEHREHEKMNGYVKKGADKKDDQQRENHRATDKYREETEISEQHSSHEESESSSGSSESRESRDDNQKSEDENYYDRDEETDDLSARLKELLDDQSSPKDERNKNPDKYAKPHRDVLREKSPYETYKESLGPAPTLAELEAKGQYLRKPEIRDISIISPDEHQEEDKKRELIFKFDLLKKSYPLAIAAIPEFSIHSDLREMEKSYENTLRKLSLDSTVETYKSYLTGGFFAVEFLFGNFLNFDMQGFSQQQILNMSSYERLLIELGEKSYVPSGSKWPVELRLLFLILINSGVFLIGKMIMRKTGANMMNLLNTPSTNKHSAGSTQAPPAPRKKMRGPRINLDDLPNTDDVPPNPPATNTEQ